MGSLFYKLGKLAGPKVRSAKWAWLSATAPEPEVIQAEYEAGCDLAAQVRRRCQRVPDSEHTRQLTEIGAALARCVKTKGRTFSFECFSSTEPQAFCLPGGFIFVSDSLMQLCGGAAGQIAFILAHEMAHVIEGHVMERMLANALIKVIARAGHVRAAGAVKQVGVQFLQRAYSRDNELQADARAARWVGAAGYNPAAGIDLFLRLQPLENKRLLGEYFSTHPTAQDRMQHLKALL